MKAIHLFSYCTVTNFTEALQTISEDLSVVGLPAIANYDEQNPAPVIVSLINTTWSLLKHKQHLMDSKRILEQRISGLSQEINTSRDKQKRLEKDFIDVQECLIKEKTMVLLKEDETTEALHKSKCLKQELQELKARLKNTESKLKNDFQRKENEIAVLQSKLRRIVYKGKEELWRGPVDNSTRCNLNDDDNVCCKEKTYKKSIYRLENNIQTLVKENLHLKKLLDDVSINLADIKTELVRTGPK